MTRLLWLPDVLRDAGLTIRVMAGAETRGRSDIFVQGVVWHSTVTKATTPDQRVAELLRDGHSTLPGPLAQLGGRRDGSFDIPALGRCNHNGYGEWGNDAVGIEFYNDGYAPLTGAQIEKGAIATAAILKYVGRGATCCKAHKETDPRRKIDPPGNMNLVRSKVAALLAGTSPAPTPSPEDLVDVIIFFVAPGGNHAYRCTGGIGKYLPTAATIQALQFIGIKTVNKPGEPWNTDIAKGFALLDGPLKNV